MTTVYTVRIVYKSGYVHDFKCLKFSITNGGRTLNWEEADTTNMPILLSLDNIESIWQVGIEEAEDE